MRLRTILLAAAAAVVALAVVAVVVVSTIDVNQYRGLIADQVKQATGRDLAIKGDLKLELGLSPTVAVNDVSFANASWGTRPTMAQVRRFEAQAELLPLVFGDIKIKRVVLVDADILLETDAQGRGNWEFVTTAAPTSTAPVGGEARAPSRAKLPTVEELSIRNAKLAYRDGRTGKVTNLALQRAAFGADSVSAPLRIEVDGAFNELPFQVAGRLGSLQALSSPGTPFPVDVQARVADAATVKVDGTIKDVTAAKGYQLTINAEGAEIARAARVAGVQLAAMGPFKINATVSDAAPGGNPSLPSLKAELGKPELALVRAEGSIREPLAQKGIALTVTAEGREIGAFSGFGVPGLAAPLPPIPALGPFQAVVKIANGPNDRPTVPELKAELGQPGLIKLAVAGSIQDPLARKGFNLAVTGEAAELRAVAEKAGIAAPISGPLKLAGKVADAGAERYALSGFTLTAANSDVAGEATLSTAGARPTITASFASTQIDLNAFAAPEGKAAPAPQIGGARPGGGGSGPGAPAPAARVFSDDPLPFDALNAADAELRYKAGKVLAKGTTLGNVVATAVLRNGEFTLRPLTADVESGKLAVEAVANVRGQSLTGKIDAKGVELGTLLEKSGMSDLLRRGKTDIAVNVRGEGRSMRALMAGLDGTATLHVGEGAIKSQYVDLLGADVVRVLSPLQDSGPQTSLNCVVSRVDIKGGVATPAVFLAETGKMILTGAGTVNLGTEQIELVFTPRPKDASLVSLAIPINVRGTLANPSFTPDAGAALRGAAGAAAGALVLGPAGVLVPFLSGGQRGGDPCAQALAQAGMRPAATGTAQPQPSAPQGQQPAQQQQQRQPQQPADQLRDLGRGLRGLFGQ